MKKIIYLLTPLMTISLLASCAQPKPQVVEHFVTFDTKGGSHIDTLRVADNSTINPPTDPTFDGYDFKGWYTTNPDPYPVGEPYTFADKITGDLTLYAYWEETGVTYHDFMFNGTHCSIYSDSTFNTKVKGGEEAKFTILPDSGYNLPKSEEVEITGLGESSVTFENGVITISPMTGNVDVDAVSHHQDYIISCNGVNCKASNQKVTEAYSLQTVWNGEGDDYVFSLTPDSGYSLPNKISVLFNGVEGTSGSDYVYDRANGTLTLKTRANIAIKIEAIPDTPIVVTYTITFNCANCEIYDETGQTKITGSTEVKVIGTHTTYCKFKVKGTNDYKAPLSKSSITVKKTIGGEDVEFEYDGKTCLITIPVSGNLTVAVSGLNKVLEDFTWSEINEISTSGRASEFFKVGNTKKVQLQHQDSNGDGADTISDGELYQTVRIIGFNEDYTELPPGGRTPDPNKAIGITFEFDDLISDENGYSLATYWNDTNETSTANYNYRASTIRKALNGSASDVNWFRFYGLPEGQEDPRNLKFATEPDYKISVLDMLPGSLTKEGILKTPSKYINIYNSETPGWEEQTVNDKLFLLSPFEIGLPHLDEEEPHTTTYSYYDGAQEEDRIKKQIKGKEGARNDDVTVDSGAYSGTKLSYAGFNAIHLIYGGALSWFRSPYAIDSTTALGKRAFFWTDVGEVNSSNTYATAYGVVPAFCI